MWRHIATSVLAISALATGCAPAEGSGDVAPDDVAPTTDVSQTTDALSLDLADSALAEYDVDQIRYSVDGDGIMHPVTGQLPVNRGGRVSGRIRGITAGSGRILRLTALASWRPRCQSITPFDLKPREVLRLDVFLNCRLEDIGAIAVNGRPKERLVIHHASATRSWSRRATSSSCGSRPAIGTETRSPIDGRPVPVSSTGRISCGRCGRRLPIPPSSTSRSKSPTAPM